MSLVNVELHCHTCFSADSLVLPEQLLSVAAARGIDRLAITDHNSIAGARAAARLDPGRVIIAEEIMTTQGELLAYFVQEEIPGGLEPGEVIRRLRQQQALISVSHPFDGLRSGAWREADLLPLLDQLDALEVFNARSFTPAVDQRAAAFARQHGLLMTVGSDAHGLGEIGRARLRMPDFSDAESMRQALVQAEIVARYSSPLVRLVSRFAVLRKKFGWQPPRP